jgi:hypothetical protein
MAYYGQNGNPGYWYPEVLYPPGGAILVDIENYSTNRTIHLLSLYFRGVKLFPWGRRPSYTYPPRFKTLPFQFPVTAVALGTTESRPHQQFTNKQDADFVLRSSQGGVLDDSMFEVYFRLRDEDEYPYSSRPVHVDTLFGQGGASQIFYVNGDGTEVQPHESGPANPALWFPEIYVPRQHQLFYDIYRDDSNFTGGIGCAKTGDYPFTFAGAKIWPQE